MFVEIFLSEWSSIHMMLSSNHDTATVVRIRRGYRFLSLIWCIVHTSLVVLIWGL